MDNALITIEEHLYLARRKQAIQLVPSLYTLREAFDRLIPCHLTKEDYTIIEVELQQESKMDCSKGTVGQTFERIAAAPLRFAKIKDNGKMIWIYCGPLKERD